MHRPLAVLALFLVVPPLGATVLVPADFREIVSGSQLIVYGRVTEVRPEWTANRRAIDTIVTLEVGTYLKGGPAEDVTFRVPGGQIGRYKSVTVGAPEFRPGEEGVFFLTARGPSVAQVFGMSQGVFRVRIDAAGRRTVVPPALMTSDDRAQPIRRGAAERKPIGLDAFAVQVREALAQGGAR